jgi:hypothetical protein
MKALDDSRSRGCVIGKALAAKKYGLGSIPMLVEKH